MGRMGTPWDIAMAVVYMASSAGAFVAGHTVVVDGANWLWKPPPVDPSKVVAVSREVEGESRGVGVAGARSRM